MISNVPTTMMVTYLYSYFQTSLDKCSVLGQILSRKYRTQSLVEYGALSLVEMRLYSTCVGTLIVTFMVAGTSQIIEIR